MQINRSLAPAAYPVGNMGKPFVFRCPTTGLNVQGYLEEREPQPGPRPRYEPMSCLACGLFHLVNSQTGQLLSDGKPKF